MIIFRPWEFHIEFSLEGNSFKCSRGPDSLSADKLKQKWNRINGNKNRDWKRIESCDFSMTRIGKQLNKGSNVLKNNNQA